MNITCDDRQTCMLLKLEGELNALSSQRFKTVVKDALGVGTTTFVVDLSAVPFIDSSGLGALVAGLKQAKLANGTLVLASLCDQARVIFEITMAYRIFDIFESPTAALEFVTS